MAGRDGKWKRPSNDQVKHPAFDHAPFDIAERDIKVEPNALVADCVTVSEAARHYCVTVNQKVPGCADSGTDCGHIPGCATCKAGSRPFWLVLCRPINDMMAQKFRKKMNASRPLQFLSRLSPADFC